MCKSNNDKTVSTELIFQSMLGIHTERQKANARLRRQGLPASLRMRCRHRGALVRSKLGAAAGRWQRKQQSQHNAIQPFHFHTARVDETDWTRRQSNNAFSGLPNGWNVLHTANDLLRSANYTSGVFGGAQIGMLRYRQSLPISSRVIPFSKFSKTFRWMGKAGQMLGTVGYIGDAISIGSDYYAMQQGQISTGRFIYRTTGAVSSILTAAYVGAMFGGPYGAAAGLVVGIAFVGGEMIYDEVSNLIDELTQGIADMERALTSGTWVPGF